MQFVLAQVVGALAVVANAIGIQQKKKSRIMLSFVVAATLFTVSFILLGAYTGAIICFIGGVETLVSYFFCKKDKKLPRWLIGMFLAASVGGGILVYQNFFDALPILAAVTYIWTLVETKESNIRKIMVFNVFLWIVYDFMVGAYVALISDVIFLTSTIVAMVRHDWKRKTS